MRKALGYIVIFGMGLLVGGMLLRNYGLFGRASDAQARRNVIAILDRAPAPASASDSAIVKAAARIEPAVVNIDVSVRRPEGINIFGEPVYLRMQGKGSGVIISPDGYIVTNNHVIEGASVIRVTLVDGRKFDGRVIGADQDADLAVVKIDSANLPAAELGDSSRLKVGEYVIAIGYPLGIGTTVTHGIISATDRENLPVGEGRILRQALQTDAPINRGNSGGALANLNGQLIGINTAIASENGGGNIGIGFAIPINAARGILKNLIEHGRTLPPPTTQPFIGIRYFPLNPDAASQYGLQPGQGIVVDRVEPLSPAEDAGLQRGSIIVAVDGKNVGTEEDVRAILARHRIGDRVTLRIMRGDGSNADVKVTLGRRPEGIEPR
jgi:S1-C subfamily serine protease